MSNRSDLLDASKWKVITPGVQLRQLPYDISKFDTVSGKRYFLWVARLVGGREQVEFIKSYDSFERARIGAAEHAEGATA